jgi:fumarate hydratase class II
VTEPTTDEQAGFRTEHDSMGEVAVPADALWGAQTQRAVQNFEISGERLSRDLIAALASIKGAGAAVNGELGVLAPDLAGAIHDAAAEVARGHYDDQFPVDVFQTGSGTSSNMNANEVIARLAARALGRPVHPNDDVNASQSSNDVFPSAIHLAAARMITRTLLPALDQLASALEEKAFEFNEVVKSGRTHLMDATPVTLGQEFGGYAAAIRHGADRAAAIVPDVGELPLGGTAVGTGLNAPPRFAASVIARLAEDTGLPLTEARDHFEAAGSRDALVAASGVTRVIAISLYKICNDLRLMGSGPRTGLGEIRIPDLQPGSSIMPGKINPVIPELAAMVSFQVIGYDAAVALAVQAGQLELNVMMPTMAYSVMMSITIMTNMLRQFTEFCIKGITVNQQRTDYYVQSTVSLATALNPYIGYAKAAEIAKESVKTGKSIIDIARSRGDLTEEQIKEILDPARMTEPVSPLEVAKEREKIKGRG